MLLPLLVCPQASPRTVCCSHYQSVPKPRPGLCVAPTTSLSPSLAPDCVLLPLPVCPQASPWTVCCSHYQSVPKPRPGLCVAPTTSLSPSFTLDCVLLPLLVCPHILHQDRAQDGDYLLLCGEWVVVCIVVHKQWLTTVYLSSSVPSSE